MGSQKQDIKGSRIKNSNVQLVQAGQNVIINNIFLRLFGRSESPKVDWDWAMKLLKKEKYKVGKRLTDTLLRCDRILMEVPIEEQPNWIDRPTLAATKTLQIDGIDCDTLDPNKRLIEVFDLDNIDGKLLVLGAPGAGKTTDLLYLAEQLVDRSDVWETIQTTPCLQALMKPTEDKDPGLLQVPLFVKLLLVPNVYDPARPISSKEDLLDKYIEQQLPIDPTKKRKKLKWVYKITKQEPDNEQARKTLHWLARNLQANNKVEFLVENMQPTWLESPKLKIFC